MNIASYAKSLGIATLVLGVAVGCASAPKPEPAPAPKEEKVGMSDEAKAAIASAKRAFEKAKGMGCVWFSTGPLIDSAEYKGNQGDNEKAIKIAKKAEAEANAAIEQCEKTRAEAAKPVVQEDLSYEVARGDTLWGISGMDNIYGNPFQWPLIYKRNADQIKDADLIFPGQTFSIVRDPSAADIDAAVNHAKTRGAWSVGESEASDQSYLSN